MRIRLVSFFILFAISIPVHAVEFNTDILDAEDKKNIDLSRFSQSGYIMPGLYQMDVYVNGQAISPEELKIRFIELSDSYSGKKVSLSKACLTKDIVDRIGLTSKAMDNIHFWHDSQCADLSLLTGFEIHPDISKGVLKINIPQLWLEYSDPSWLPASRWDNGIPGIFLDYNINGLVNKAYQGNGYKYLSYNGTAGANIGPWRLRGDYQGKWNGASGGSESNFSWNRFYLFRAIPDWQANLTIGENYINSDIFSSWSYTGASLESDDRMLPPKLRGYAPQISGIADTNAQVVISQQGRILYNSTVPAGPFTIQDLDSSVRGRLDVEIIEQDGRKKSFTVDTAYVPYLTRPGQIQYKLAAGKPRIYEHVTEKPVFSSGEFSWGIDNKWSLYGGGIFSDNYNATAIGIGRDLSQFGSLSADITQSFSRIPDEGSKSGKSWRISYSKRFDNENADITFAGYRFSERDYMTMAQYLNARYQKENSGNEKELYSIILNKYFEKDRASLNLQYSHQTYWDIRPTDYYTVSLNKYIDFWNVKGASLGISGTRTQYLDSYNNSVFMRLSIPFGNGYAGYNGSISNNRYTHTISYSDNTNGGLDSYSINAGISKANDQESVKQFGGFYTHNSPIANISVNMSSVEKSYTSFGLSASGGATITGKGSALHSGGINGGTRLVVDTDGVGGVPIDGGRVITNSLGIGVVTNVSSYYRNNTSIDIDRLPENIEASRSVVESVLTEGAIGYQQFGVLKGEQLFATIRLKDGDHPPFGASVMDYKGREVGIVSENGFVWLSGINSRDNLSIVWNGRSQCEVSLPNDIKPKQQLLLLCMNK